MADHETNAKALQTSQQTSLQNLKPLSAEGFERACSYLRSDDKPTSSTRLLPPDVCDRIIAMCADEVGMEAQDCIKASMALMAGYAGATINMPEADKAALVKTFQPIFAAYPRSAAIRVCDGANGLPSRLAFIPKPFDVKQALEAELTKSRMLAVKAKWHKDEAARRAKAAELDAMISKTTAEERAAYAAAAIQRLAQSAPASEAAA